MTTFVIIGAGPVGLLAALAVQRAITTGGSPGKKQTVVVYERRSSLEQRLEESYPIGVSPRGLRALRMICPPACERVEATGVLVDSWDVYAGNRQVGSIQSGTTLGHTRYSVTDALYEQVKQAGIQVYFGYKLTSLDVEEKKLTFECHNDKIETVDCRQSIVIAADGSGSATRQLLFQENHQPSCTPLCNDKTPWNIYFRVLVMDTEGAEEPAPTVPLNPHSHSIYNGVYTALIGPPGQRQWVVVPSGQKNNTNTSDWFFYESDDPPAEAMTWLRQFIASKVPPLKDTDKYFSNAEMKAFFSRRLFTGNLVSLSPLHYPHCLGSEVSESTQHDSPWPWILFLGDSAHGVFPATGEGLNSGLDDVLVFCHTVIWPAYGKEGQKLELETYTAARQPDVDALSYLAKQILLMTTGTPQERATSLVTTILSAMARSVGLIGPSEAELRYGPSTSKELLPYQEVLKRHLRDTRYIRSFAGAVVSICFGVTKLFACIWSVLSKPFATKQHEP